MIRTTVSSTGKKTVWVTTEAEAKSFLIDKAENPEARLTELMAYGVTKFGPWSHVSLGETTVRLHSDCDCLVCDDWNTNADPWA